MSKELSRNIRKLCNHPWKRELLLADKSKWYKLWASVDLINDTQHAIDFYINIPEKKFLEGGYLYVYGILQALYVQQDAAINLNQALFDESIDFKKNYPELYIIREQRNDSIGHPSGRGKNNSDSFHIINGTSIVKSGFELMSHYPNKNKAFQISRIDINKCIDLQNKLLNNILEQVMNKLKMDFELHKKRFKGTPLINVVNNSISYSISKLYEFESPLVSIEYRLISETYEKIKDGIQKRYTNLNALPGVQLTCERIDYILNRLKRDLVDSPINDHLEIEVFVDALKYHFNDLIEMVEEIDKEFEK